MNLQADNSFDSEVIAFNDGASFVLIDSLLTVGRRGPLLVHGTVGAGALTGLRLGIRPAKGQPVINLLTDADFATLTTKLSLVSGATIHTTGAAGTFFFEFNPSPAYEVLFYAKGVSTSLRLVGSLS